MYFNNKNNNNNNASGWTPSLTCVVQYLYKCITYTVYELNKCFSIPYFFFFFLAKLKSEIYYTDLI